MKSLAAYRKRRRTARNVEENDASTQTQMTSNISINENDETNDEDPEYCNDDELLELIRRRQDYRIMLVFFIVLKYLLRHFN